MRQRRSLLLITLLAGLGLLVACTVPARTNPSAAPVTEPTTTESDVPLRSKAVWTGSYARDIQPIFDQYCVECHDAAKAENGLRLDSYEGLMKGTQHGPVVTPGVPGTSTLVAVVQGLAAPEIRMPQGHRRLSPNRSTNIELWIEAGAKKD